MGGMPPSCHLKKEKSQKGSPMKINILKVFKKQLKILHDQIQSNSPSDKFRNCTDYGRQKTGGRNNRYPNLPSICFYCKTVIRVFLLLNGQFVALALFFKKFNDLDNKL